ncbi:hypothetical protein M2306_000406 [Myroides gitamensis]|uniref:hypothetical protein n=1 Tax=Myroides odoratus TaxID=256 RepID=UPI00216A3A49|nr:hypothetical protein [Myroides odoratus]MCS4239029.1 hypothetical protein [Myroides odoratus]MDH6599712.1 hypothetical protein [Myroides gitamensis]
MKNFMKNIGASLFSFLILSIVLLHANSTQAQIRKSFEPRQSTKAPAPYTNVKNYNLQGDFLMLGNTSLTLSTYALNKDNSNNSMVYVNVDTSNGIVNSSSAELVLPGGECTEIVYAGLYWSGRAHNGGQSSDQFTVRKNRIDYTLHKRKVKLKKGSNAYIDVEASVNDIYYPSDKDGNMYSAYADITAYVRQNGAGNYTVANLALIEGNGGGTGFYGGWGMVIIYKNATMKWRDITVFDGHAYVAGGNYKYELPISGFKASQYGNVNVTLGMMAGEGDRTIDGDYFEIKRGNNYDRLSHGGNTTGNFFNSSIAVGNTARNPSLINNTGFDIAKFDLDNSSNKYIGNNATNATFRYGSTQDTYVIYNIVFAVDAYVPEIIGENKAIAVDGVTPSNNGQISPGQRFGFELDVYNKGTEAVNDSKIAIPVPSNLHFAGANVQTGFPGGGSVNWFPPTGGTNDPNVTAGGTIVWDIGVLPLDQRADKSTLLAKLKYYFKVSDNCVLLSTNVCGLEVRINGKISGVGATSTTEVGSDLVRDYGSGTCAGPVYDDFISTISLSVDFLQNCNPPVENNVMQFKAFCQLPGNGTAYPRTEVVSKYPIGTKFFSTIPSSYDSTTGVVSNDFTVNTDGSKKMYYVMTPGMGAGCYARLEISVDKVVTEPTTKDSTVCLGEPIVLENALSQTGVTNQYALVYFAANGTTKLEGEPNPTTVGVHNYFVAEGKDGCVGPKKPFTITINALPVINGEVADMEICSNFDVTTTVQTTGSGLSYTWEYSTTGTTWQTLTDTTFSNKVVVTDNTIAVKHADNQLNGTKLRLKVSNNTCTATSNVFEIKVKDCPAVTNPMLLNSAIQ